MSASDGMEVWVNENAAILNKFSEAAHTNACRKGWHEKHKPVAEDIALMHSELSEALEEYRNGRAPDELYFSTEGKPEGIPAELADVIIRIFDFCGKHEIDLGEAVAAKMAYNTTRPYRHGNKVV